MCHVCVTQTPPVDLNLTLTLYNLPPPSAPAGTHYLRAVNNTLQPWGSSGGRKRLGLRPVNPTEEGLASIHSVLYLPDPTFWRAALLYYTVHQAALSSFTQLFHHLGRFVHDPDTRWDYCVRAKRGQTDTSQPGTDR